MLLCRFMSMRMRWKRGLRREEEGTGAGWMEFVTFLP